MTSWTPKVRKLGADAKEQVAFANALISEGRFDQAHDELKKALNGTDSSAEVSLAMGRLCRKQEKLAEAGEHFARAMEQSPGNARVRVVAGNAFLKIGDLDHAREAYEEAIAIDAKFSNAYLGLGQLAFRKSDFNEAARQLHLALRYNPQLVRARLLLARVSTRSGDRNEAMGELKSVVSLKGNHAQASIRMARSHLKHKQPQKAAEILMAAIEGDAKNSRLWELQGQALMQSGDHAGAEEALKEALLLKPSHLGSRLRLVDALLAQSKTEEARKLLEGLSRKGRVSALVHKYLGQVYEAQGHYKEAAESYRAAVLTAEDGEQTVAAIEASNDNNGDGDDTAAEPEWQSICNEFRPAAVKVVANARRMRRAQKAS